MTRSERRGRRAFLLGGVPLVAGAVLLVFGLLYEGDGSRLMFFAPAILLLTLGAWILGNGWLAVRATRPGRGEARGRPRGR